MGHTVYRISAIVLSFLQVITCCGVISMYVIIICNRKRASFTENTIEMEKLLPRKMILQIVLITGSNIACWVPSGIIYILSALTCKFPVTILLYTTIYITPVNSIVNPVFINFVYTKYNTKKSKIPKTYLSIYYRLLSVGKFLSVYLSLFLHWLFMVFE